MKYYKVYFKIIPLSGDARDILAAIAGEVGFEAFEESNEGLTGYVQQTIFEQTALDEALSFFPMENVKITYLVKEAEDKDWNEQWEQEGFDPIIIQNGRLVIHDGRHLPEKPTTNIQQTNRPKPLLQSKEAKRIAVEIDARLAFGTGTHETTRMVCETLLDEPLKDKKILDAGCGTGILAIVALKLGAKNVTAYDIDEWSSENTVHNAIINQVENNIQVFCGNASVLDSYNRDFDYIVANINRNILLQDMERFRLVMKANGTLIMSGFYTEDIPLLETRGKELGLTVVGQKEDNHWACIIMREQ